jgi:hypothetical protein
MTLLQERASAFIRLPAECMQLSQKQLSRMHGAAAISYAANSLNVLLSCHSTNSCLAKAWHACSPCMRALHLHRFAVYFSLTFSAVIMRLNTRCIQISRGLCELQAIHLLPRYCIRPSLSACLFTFCTAIRPLQPCIPHSKLLKYVFLHFSGSNCFPLKITKNHFHMKWLLPACTPLPGPCCMLGWLSYLFQQLIQRASSPDHPPAAVLIFSIFSDASSPSLICCIIVGWRLHNAI